MKENKKAMTTLNTKNTNLKYFNKKYLQEVFASNEDFPEEEYPICSIEDMADQIISYIVSNFEYDYGMSLDVEQLFKEKEN